MPIGFDRGGFGGSARDESRPTRLRSPEGRTAPPTPGPPEPANHRVLTATATTRPALVIVARWTRWVTASDERTCPACAPLHGMIWREGEGPQPPLHGNCRCTRVGAFVEVASR
jgi:hypothetical protein